MNDLFIAGVDIGGSHITVSIIDSGKHTILEHTRRRAAVNAQDSAQNIIASWSRVIKESFSAQGIAPTRLGIAMPGPFDYEEGIALMKDQNKYDALYGLNVKELLAAQLDMKPEDISITNDAACFLQGELFAGVAQNTEGVIGLTLGTGLGSARAISDGAEDANLWCSPFKEGIAEDYLSTRWFVQRYYELTGSRVRDVKELVTLESTDPFVGQVFTEFGSNLGQFLFPYILSEGLQLVVLGGNIAHALPLFSAGLREEFLQKGIEVKVERSLLGEDAALAGAASFCLQAMHQDTTV